jgi:hypothetical protein
MQPILSNIEKMSRFRKFRAGNQLDEMLDIEKSSNPQGFPYLIGFDFKTAGYLVLAYLPQRAVCREPIKVTPDGFEFRQRQFESAEKLVEFFKSDTSRQFSSQVPPSAQHPSNYRNHQPMNQYGSDPNSGRYGSMQPRYSDYGSSDRYGYSQYGSSRDSDYYGRRR